MLRTYFPYALISLLFGVGIASFFSIGSAEMFVLCVVGVALLFLAPLYRSKRLFIAACLFAFALLGMMRYEIWRDAPLDNAMESHVGAKVTIYGVVDDEPDLRENSTHLRIAVRSIQSDEKQTPAFGRALISVARFPEYNYGDVLQIEGKLEHPKKFTEEDGRVFDYPAYLATKGIHYQISFGRIVQIDTKDGNIVLATLFSMKHKFLAKLADILPEPENSLLGGLLLGGKQSLGAEWQDIFRKAGIVHVVVLSGYNMTIVSEWIVAAFAFLGFYGSLSVGSIGIILFALMTGAGATVLRAAIMALIALLARATGRTYDMGRALLVAGTCMVLQNPSILANDPSFQLSFLASLGLIFVSPVIEARTKLFSRFPAWREVFVSTLATQIIVLPLLLLQTGVLSLVALPVNMLVLPVIPLTMLLGFVAGVATFILPMPGYIVAFPAHILLLWILSVAKLSVAFPHAAVSLPLSPAIILALYIVIAVILWRAHVVLLSKYRGVPPLPLSNSSVDKKGIEQ